MSVALLDCPTDGLVPVESPVSFNEESDGYLELNLSVPCPMCRQQVNAVPVKMHPDGSVEFELTEAQIVELNEAYRWAIRVTADQSVSPVEVVSRLLTTFRKISPMIPHVLTALASKKGVAVATWVGVVFAAATYFAQIAATPTDEPSTFSVEEIERLYEVFERSQGGAPTPQSPRFPMPVVEPPQRGATEHP